MDFRTGLGMVFDFEYRVVRYTKYSEPQPVLLSSSHFCGGRLVWNCLGTEEFSRLKSFDHRSLSQFRLAAEVASLRCNVNSTDWIRIQYVTIEECLGFFAVSYFQRFFARTYVFANVLWDVPHYESKFQSWLMSHSYSLHTGLFFLHTGRFFLCTGRFLLHIGSFSLWDSYHMTITMVNKKAWTLCFAYFYIIL